MEMWGKCPQRGPGAEPLIRGPGGRSPSEAEALLAFARSMEAANLAIFLKFTNANKVDICVLFLQKNHSWQRNWRAWSKTGGLCPGLKPPLGVTNEFIHHLGYQPLQTIIWYLNWQTVSTNLLLHDHYSVYLCTQYTMVYTTVAMRSLSNVIQQMIVNHITSTVKASTICPRSIYLSIHPALMHPLHSTDNYTVVVIL